MTPIEEQAHAKINLALHVTGQRDDGYHLLDTLVAFTREGDRLTFAPSAENRFTLSGRFGPMLEADADGGNNLVLRARDGLAALLAESGRLTPPVHIHLEKNLPLSSGIGGGSADAAATLRGLQRLWNFSPDPGALARLALSLGADVPMCLESRSLIARGIGEEIMPVTLPAFPILLVNPLLPVSTPAVFRLLTNKDNAPLPPAITRAGRADARAIAALRNDLQPPAERLEPVIAALIAEIAATGADVARMSGSGATCFGLFPDGESLSMARETLSARHPDWYVAATSTLAD